MIHSRRAFLLSLSIAALGAAAAGAGVQRFVPSASIPGGSIRFGSGVGADQSLALVGAPNSGALNFSGTIEVFEQDDLGLWSSTGLIQAATPVGGSGFGYQVYYRNGLAITSSPGDAARAGSIHFFERDPSPPHGWSSPTRVVAPDGAPEDLFGRAFSVSGSRVAVGALNAHIPNTEIACGAVYVYLRVGGGYQLEQKLQPVADCPELLGSHEFGAAVALDGDTLVASLLPGVIIYERISGVWQETGRIFPGPDANGNNQSFGRQIALEGNRLLVASPVNRRVYIYEKTGGSWSLVGQLAPSDPALSIDYGGDAVALQGDLALVGCTGCPLGQSGAPGIVYLYERQPGGAWLLVRRFVGPEPSGSFGRSIDFDGSQAWIGAETANPTLGSNRSGAAYLLDVAPAVFADGFESGDAGAWTLVEEP